MRNISTDWISLTGGVTRSWTSTLRSIIPLPNPTSTSHLPHTVIEEFPKGSIVLGLYPDTTSFYRATVISAPAPGTATSLGVKNGNGKPDTGAKREKYRLSFVDDGDKVFEVHRDFVVTVSSEFMSLADPNASSLLECHVPILLAGEGSLINILTSLLY